MEQSAPRVGEADRSQLQLRPFDLDSTIPHDHRARLLWRAVETLDLSAFYERIKSRVGTAGRPPGDPKVFVTLWLYATMDGVGLAREVERLCTEHRAYWWICGGVAVNYHTLSDFRVDHGNALDELLTQTLAVLMERTRMGSDEGQAIYKERAQLSERVNADVRTYRTMNRMLVRGAGKVLCVALWNALALNLMRWFALASSS